jgi:hypothetical protein
MTRNEYLSLAGEYCIKMEWNHDAIPELAECLEQHDKRLNEFLDGERIARQYAIDKGVELQRENTILREALRECLDGAAYTVSVAAILDPSTRHIGLEKLDRHRSLLPDAVDVCPDSYSVLPNAR